MRFLILLLLVLAALPLGGCEVVGDIFQAGMWVGAIMIAVIVGVIAFIAAKMRS